MRRRSFLTALALAGLAGCDTAAGPVTSGFGNRLRIPPLLDPPVDASGVRRFELALRRGQTEFLPGRPVDTWGINGTYLGPTLRARRGDRVAFAVANRVGDPTTLHWHGMRLPAVMDGGPHQVIAPDSIWSPEWTIDQRAATCWYHPHPHEQTARHVYRGLAGLFLLDDPDAPELPRQYGVDDIPVIIQDKRFDQRGAMIESFDGTFGLTGDTVLVNGTLGPFLDITTTRVRFRLLNASNARIYGVGFADRRTFQVIATDSGLLPAPVDADRVVLSPGERLEIVAEFTPGEQVLLRSTGDTSDGANAIERGDFDLVSLNAEPRLRQVPPVPAVLSTEPPIHPAPNARVRRFVLTGFEINHRPMDLTRIDEVVPAGAQEIWEIDNTTYTHNFHIHDAAFRVLQVNGAEPEAYLRGPKDTVYVPKLAKVRLAVRFGTHTDPRTPYMYHCHILRHEDQGMMGQFVVVAPGTEDGVSRQLPAPAHHR
ncbi:multicopper oxidase family protein [Actinokineospora cianjurensis]|uniref:Cell division protein SufI n=1 Tax=Actinokineospora cianjurensis TaxID=585224 RepID=A0A421BC17_9PSEU|nr:multicopper oxidase domain-containing protein [Actinokineospora cianjurensis]RLK61887.1 cell division protein SufI [Actinokineospora cianjurensis]